MLDSAHQLAATISNQFQALGIASTLEEVARRYDASREALTAAAGQAVGISPDVALQAMGLDVIEEQAKSLNSAMADIRRAMDRSRK